MKNNKFHRLKTAGLAILCSTLSLAERTATDYFPDSQLTTTGVYYYPEHWDVSQWERDFKNMAELGFEFTHFAEFAWAQLEPQEGVYDFAWLDHAIELAAKHKLKIILCTSTATPPVWLTRKYPEILITQENGVKLDHGARQHASFSNPTYRALALKMIDALAKRYGKDKRIMGWQLDNEPGVQYDFGPQAEKAFRSYLTTVYPDIDSLNAAWGTPFWSQVYHSFEEITLPKLGMMFMNPHHILDYRRFASLQTANFLDEQSRCIKQYANKNQFVTTNLIPTYDEGHIGIYNDLDFHSYTRYMVFGDDKGIGRKGYRLGNPWRIAYANDFFRPLENQFGVMELQPGQVNWGNINSQPLPGAIRLWLWHVFAGGSDFTCAYRFRQPLSGMEQYHYGIVGTDGISVTPGGNEYKQFNQEIHALRSNVAAFDTKPTHYTKRKVGILWNHENAWNMSRQPQNTHWDTHEHIRKYYKALKRFGAPVDVIRENDSFENYLFMLVPAYQLVDDALIARWKAYAEQGGHLILTARTGHKDRHGRIFEGKFGYKLFDLIGAEMNFFDLLQAHTPDPIVMEGKQYDWFTWGENFTPYENTEVWATYAGDYYDGAPAILHRSLGKGTVTYVGVDSQDGEMEEAVLRKVYDRAQVAVEHLPDGLLIEYRNGLGIAVNYADQAIRVDVPGMKKIRIGVNPVPTAGVLVWDAR